MFRILVLVRRVTFVFCQTHIVVLNERGVDPAGEHAVLGGFLLVEKDKFHITPKLDVLIPTRNVAKSETLLLEGIQFSFGRRIVIVNNSVERICSNTNEERLTSTIDVELGTVVNRMCCKVRTTPSIERGRSIHT